MNSENMFEVHCKSFDDKEKYRFMQILPDETTRMMQKESMLKEAYAGTL